VTAPAATSAEAIRVATGLLQENGPPTDALAALQAVAEGDPLYARAQYLRGACRLRLGEAEEARRRLVDSIRRGERTVSAWVGLAQATCESGMPEDTLGLLLQALRSVSSEQFTPFSAQLLQALGFNNRDAGTRNDVVFEKLVVPLLATLLERREMDNAIRLESLVYEYYVKATETEAHFGACMAWMEPLFAASGREWRKTLPPLPQPELRPPYKVGFFIHNASMLAHIEVLLNTLKGYRRLEEQPFEATVYAFGGNSPEMEAALERIGVRLVMLDRRYPETRQSPWKRLLALRELLSEEGVHELVWVSLVTMLPLAFGMRMAPVQTWFAMKYRNYSNADIDGYLTGSALTRFGTMAGRSWRMHILGVDDWYAHAHEAKASEIRASLQAEIVLMTLARTEKMHDPQYLGAVVALLQAHPNAMFVWAGREEAPDVVARFRDGGVLERTRFVGWVDTRLYAQVADIFLDSFPFPCGFTLFQAMAAGKPVVIYNSPEAAITGLWSFLRPLIEGNDGTADERAEVRTIVGDEQAPNISLARSPEDYVRLTSRLIVDAAARGAAGEASKAFMTRYFSDPRAMGASVAGHLVELIEERAAASSV
jgi:glycosyltransferase involved in cell wall biosynthesis